MIMWLLRKLLSFVGTDDLAFRVEQAKEQYRLSLEETKEKAEEVSRAVGAVLFVAGQHLSVLQHVMKEAEKALQEVGDAGEAGKE